MEKEIITPILLTNENKNFKLFYINFAKDGSIYLFFPKKCGYKIKSSEDINFSITKYQKIVLKNINETFFNPYISFHPKNLKIHINCLKKRFKPDFSIAKRENKDKHIAFPFVQIVYPNEVSYLDEYKKDKYINPLIIGKEKNIKKGLSIEIWVHPIGTYIDPNDLPLKEERGKTSAFKFSNQNLTEYTCSLFISEIDIEDNFNFIGNMIITTFNSKIPFVFELIPNLK